MLTSSASRAPLFIAVCAGVAVAAAFLAFLPFAELSSALLMVLPFACVLFLVIVLDPRLMATGLLLTRVLLDPLLEKTRLDQGGLGLGAALNLFAIVFTAVLLLRNARGLRGNPLTGRWLLFLGVCAASVFWSPMPVRSARLLFGIASYPCMAVLPFLIDPERNDKRFWMGVLIVSSFLPVLAANVDFVLGGRTYEDAGSRIAGTFTHPNILAFYLVFVIGIVFYALRSGQIRLSAGARLALVAYLVDLFALLLATKTRNAWISCWVFFLVYGFLKERRFVLVALAAGAAALALPQVASRAADLSSGSGVRTNSFAWRVELWKSSLPWIKDRLFLGYGLATFQELSRNFFTLERRQGADAHNAYVQVLFETGVTGLFAYLWIYWGILRTFLVRVRHAVRPVSIEYAIATATVVTYLLSSFADNMFYYLALNWYFWFFVGVMLKTARFHGAIRLGRRSVV